MNLSNFLVEAIFFLFIFMSGRWVKQRGMPYPVLLVTVHKLIALAAGIYIGWKVYLAGTLNQTQIGFVVLTVILFAVNVATGSIFSRNKPVPDWVATANRVVPYVTIVSTILLSNLLVV